MSKRRGYSVYALQSRSGGIYIGSSYWSGGERYGQHRRGYKSRLRGDWAPARYLGSVPGFESRADAEYIEREVARQLRREGYWVRQG